MPSKCACGKFANFGLVEKKPTHCKGCKTDGMVDVKSKRCACGHQVTFGFYGGKAMCCNECKADGMVNVKSKTCACGHQATFGFSGEKAKCCKECKVDGMEDVKNTKCSCGKRLAFGFPGGRATCCMRCKEAGMVNVVSKKCSCGKQPVFGNLKGRPTHCARCRDDKMVDVVNKICQGYGGAPCPVNTFLCGREYCLACDPDESRKLSRKRDEAAFFTFLNKHIAITQQDYPVHYRCIDANKTMARVDGVIITKDIVVCLELDEDGHDTYDPTCEEARMHNVSAELQIAYPDHCVAWVRVNPHTKKNGKRDTLARAHRIRDQRHQEALEIIKDILQQPRDCIEYVGYDRKAV